MSIITNKFRSKNTNDFIQDFTNSDYYIFASSTGISQSRNSEFSVNEFLENTLFGKKVDPTDVFNLIDNTRWVLNTVYTQYDDKVDLTDKKFYAIVYPTDNTAGNYQVFKCLSNNHGAQSKNAPNYDPQADDQIYRTVDGYVWKFMYSFSTLDYQKYSALSYVPVIYPYATITGLTATGTAITFTADNTFAPGMLVTITGVLPSQYNFVNRPIVSVTPTSFTVAGTETGAYQTSQGTCIATNSSISKRSIDHIEVENFDLNKGYELKEGDIKSVEINNIVITTPKNDLSNLPDYYANQYLYVTNTFTNESRVYNINTYRYSESTLEGILTVAGKDSFIEANLKYQILPRVEIIGDGSGALGVPVIDATAGTIESILMLNKGSGYTRASARVVNPLYGFDTASALSTDVEAILRPILSPEGGHGSNLEEELISRRVLVYGTLSDTENLSIPSTNRYTKIGLVKNPQFTSNTVLFDNRLKLEFDSSILTVGEIVTQNYFSNSNEVAFSAEVHEIVGNVVYFCNYHGPYQNYPVANTVVDGYEDIPINYKMPIISSQGQSLIINKSNSERPPYIQKTGDVYYMTSFSPITRTASSNEEYKIVIEF